MVVVQVSDNDCLNVMGRQSERGERPLWSDKKAPPAPCSDGGVEPRVYDDRAVGIAEDPKVIVEGLRTIGFVVALPPQEHVILGGSERGVPNRYGLPGHRFSDGFVGQGAEAGSGGVTQVRDARGGGRVGVAGFGCSDDHPYFLDRLLGPARLR